jgi:menaquinone-dependent protoporphyrinogen oxidase
MDPDFEKVQTFIRESQGTEFSSPRSVFKKGEEEKFSYYTSDDNPDELLLISSDGSETALSVGLVNEAVLYLLDIKIAVIAPESTAGSVLSLEEHLEIWHNGTSETPFDSKVVPYIADLIVLSGIAAYGWATAGDGEKLAAIALKTVTPKKHTAPRAKETAEDVKGSKGTKGTADSTGATENRSVTRRSSDKAAAASYASSISSAGARSAGRKTADGTNCMPKGIALITYSVKDGVTSEIAWSVKNSFVDGGIETEVKSIQDVEDVRKYSFVVVGAGLKENRLAPEVIEFAKLHRHWLSKRPVALFIVGESLKDIDDEKVIATKKIAESFTRILDVVDIGMFAGRVDAEDLTMRERLFEKERIGDFRDWRIIGEWADDMKNACLKYRNSKN